jgi:hypothetical protein
MSNIADFQLSVTRALRDQLLEALGKLGTESLTEANLVIVDSRPGVYQLFVGEELMYVGKAAKNLRERLDQHRKKLSGRRSGLLASASFKCVYVSEDMDAIAPETMLIAHFRQGGQAPWNFNGFGNKDPGKERDTSVVKAGHFDSLHQIDLELELGFRVTGGEPLVSAMKRFKGLLPYVFRFGTVPGNLEAPRPNGSPTAVRDWLAYFAAALPENWSVVALPGYVIAYPDKEPEQLASRIESWKRHPDGAVRWEVHTPEFDSSSIQEVAIDEET